MAVPKKLHHPPASQRPVDTSLRGAPFIFHTLSIVIMVNGFLAMSRISDGMPVFMPAYGGYWQFLTIIGLLAAGTTFVFAIFIDLAPAINVFRSAKRTFLLIAMPANIVVASIYWPLIMFVPSLMLPAADVPTGEPTSSDSAPRLFRIPLWMDLSMHALPAVALVIDFFILEKKYTPPTSTIRAPLLTAGFSAVYALWVEHCASVNRAFPYPFLTAMDLPGRITLYACATAISVLIFRGLNRLHA